MDSKEIRSLMESYNAIYQEDNGIDLDLDLTGIEDISDEEIDAIVEETIAEMIEEGYDFDEVEEIFEEVLSEAAITDRAAARREYMRSSEKAAKEARKRGAAVVKKEKRAEKIAQLKGAVKSALGRARDAVSDARKGVSKRIDSAKSSATQAAMRATNVKPSDVGTDRRGKPLNKGNFDTKYAKNRAKARQAIGAKIQSKISGAVDRAKAKVGRGIEKAKTAKAGVASAAASAPGAVNSAVRRGIGGAARALSRGARNVARKLGEDFDVYDIILEHLISEGYADTEEAATKIMANMSEEWRQEIINAEIQN